MTSPQASSTVSQLKTRAGEAISGAPRWKKVVITGAALLLTVGLILTAYEAATGEPSRPTGRNNNLSSRDLGPGMGSSLVGDREGRRSPSSSGETRDPQGDGDGGNMSPAMVRGGFGFFIGFAIGIALRMFFRISLFFVGLNVLLLLGMSHLGWVDVRWDIMHEQFDHWNTRFGDEFAQFRTFVAGSLPTVGLSSLGIFTGFRKG